MDRNKQMKKLLFLLLSFAIATGCVNQKSVENTQEPASTPLQQPTTNTQSTTPKQTLQLEVATVKSLEQGDIMCYATLLDDNKIEHHVGASFDICNEQDQYLNKKVRLGYEEVNVNDCQSIEPCGKSRKEQLITTMSVIK